MGGIINMYKPKSDCQIKNLAEIYQKYFGYRSTGFFVEVGGYDGDSFSNTAFLADLGWKGVYVEPIPQHCMLCQKRHEGNDVKVVNVAVGLEEGITPIYYGAALTTLDKNQAQRYSEMDWAKHIHFSETYCEQQKLSTVLENQNVPKDFDILVVDVEGKEEEVFKTFSLDEWNPKMLIVEIEDEHPSFQKYPEVIQSFKSLRAYIKSKGYVEVQRDMINTIYIKEEV